MEFGGSSSAWLDGLQLSIAHHHYYRRSYFSQQCTQPHGHSALLYRAHFHFIPYHSASPFSLFIFHKILLGSDDLDPYFSRFFIHIATLDLCSPIQRAVVYFSRHLP